MIASQEYEKKSEITTKKKFDNKEKSDRTNNNRDTMSERE